MTGQNLADGSRLGLAGLSAREADLVRASVPSVGPALSGGGRLSRAGASVDLATGPAALHAVLRSVPDENVRRKVCLGWCAPLAPSLQEADQWRCLSSNMEAQDFVCVCDIRSGYIT